MKQCKEEGGGRIYYLNETSACGLAFKNDTQKGPFAVKFASCEKFGLFKMCAQKRWVGRKHSFASDTFLSEEHVPLLIPGSYALNK
jgi:hypothetical protein